MFGITQVHKSTQDTKDNAIHFEDIHYNSIITQSYITQLCTIQKTLSLIEVGQSKKNTLIRIDLLY